MYPSRLLIFHSPTLETTFIGTTKLTLLGGFVMSCLVVAPNVYLDEAAPIWMAPAGDDCVFEENERLLIVLSVIATAAFFMTGCHLMTRPYITNVFIQPPGWARRSKEALLNFARRLPSDTVLEIETLGFLPVPRRKAVRLSDLRTVPQGFGLANLERVAANEGTSKLPKSMRWSLNQFYARPSAGHWQKSRAPDVWPLVWEFVSKNSVGGMSKESVSSTVAKPAARSNDGVQKRVLPVASAVTKSQQKSRRG